ncbi:MAG: dTMP kinase [Thermoflexales bacterium]
MLITFEGLDGSGKTTQIARLAPWLTAQGYSVLTLREPGGTTVGDALRNMLHDPAFGELCAHTELLLYSASRAQLVAERIRPHLAQGDIVLCDRFADSTLAYQGYGRGLPLDFLRQLQAFVTQGVQPALTIYMEIPVEESLRRRVLSGEFNRMDQQDIGFYQRVALGYRELIAQEPHRWHVVDAMLPPDQVEQHLRALIAAQVAKLYHS